MKVLVVGGGGREHAICWAIAASPACERLWCAPGNAGIAEVAECLEIPAEDVEGLMAFCREARPELVIVGPEAPLVAGLVDRLEEVGIAAFGPSAAAAALEGSKGFMKDLCARQGIPTAAYGRFTDAAAAKDFAREQGAPIVVKADGLAAGKGVSVCATLAEAEAAIDAALLEGRFGSAGAEVVIEEFLDGEEVSFFALCDGTTALPLASAQDHKRAFDGDAGPNTGGMGAYSPAPLMTPALQERVMREIVEPTVRGMAAEGRPFRGVLFAGLMIASDGTPRLLEHNVRFGDPECQTLMLRLESDLLAVLSAAAKGRLSEVSLSWSPQPALTVVLAAEGYPDSYEKGTKIRGLEQAAQVEGVTLFHAGTRRAEDGSLQAAGGRVLNVCAQGEDLAQARERAYAAVARIDWPQGFCRKDIGWRALT
ncbi:phosphoribosylamine--glycine ligase [Aquibaculum arenosum]|uniref:Phosphoribosylamine--glycine ligase n=1 Tax=Aquibaculum arenosum TaxID=3032591 RepID=A0ABT5YKL3_9PROT|nr:phosphoribosylamine--glycine ligase [Fodinicurvata sp. CAU 1616]MDF2095403.1 phosphoribosylamine--glycine ligase [Fodinicurvata sp. CAU 1616]